MTVGATDLALPDFLLDRLKRHTFLYHSSDALDFVAQMIEMQGMRVGVVPTVYALLPKFIPIDECSEARLEKEISLPRFFLVIRLVIYIMLFDVTLLVFRVIRRHVNPYGVVTRSVF